MIFVFRDVLDGIWYWLYLFLCMFAFFYFLGIVADNKREKINKKLKEKKTYDIESGREAEIAAMETKQVLAVENDGGIGGMADAASADSGSEIADLAAPKKEEVPSVMVLNSDGSTPQTPQNGVQPAVVQPAVVQPAVTPVVTPAVVQPAVSAPQVQSPTVQAPQKAEEPLVLNSSTN